MCASNQSADLEPRHIAIIMDGNGRWAAQRHLPRVMGHRAGMGAVRRVVKACRELGVPMLTLYAFSWENWQRPAEEIRDLMGLLVEFARKETADLKRNNVRAAAIGRVWELPPAIREWLDEVRRETAACTGLRLNLALSYGGRQELVDAVRHIAEAVRRGEVEPPAVDEELVARYLYQPDMPDPDLLIRTSGEMRVSNFLLWQIAYTEMYVTDTLWPDFQCGDLEGAIAAFRRRQRRFGRTDVRVVS